MTKKALPETKAEVKQYISEENESIERYMLEHQFGKVMSQHELKACIWTVITLSYNELSVLEIKKILDETITEFKASICNIKSTKGK